MTALNHATSYPAVLTVDLDAIARNYLFLKNTLKAGADCAAVVKAEAYGLGMAPVAKTLYAQNCRHFFVATMEEGISLRQTLSADDARIYVLHDLASGPLGDLTAHRLIPVLNTPGDIGAWQAHARATNTQQPCLLHLDTGMNRLGISPQDIAQGYLDADRLERLDVRYIMSHLACADDPAHPKNAEQLEKFQRLTQTLNLPARYSLANTGGILLGPDYHFDLVRPGCGLYGMNVHNEEQNPFEHVITAAARILQIRDVPAGETIGYGATYKVENPARIATISVGYADGLFRHLTGRGCVRVQGVTCPMVGRISMDSIVVDISALTTPVKPGDMAEVIGPSHTIDMLAAEEGTLGYEVLTALGRRYHRIYKGG